MLSADLINGVGVTLILLAFFLQTFNLISDKSTWYFLINIVGAGLACWGSVLIESLPFTILEAVWTLVSVVGLVRLWVK